ncbi:Transcriptional regulatory protein containing a sigma-54 interaction domain [Salinibacter ruber M8]|uniref:Transcriptional regulatory protein containing a sigma-54 interaction domain n=1 Tax=Salinibacter ruber (strain M8) TaxID=761659 RepID=D5H8F6_SALRM|nr:Transcriptional regulatory protein containing a sigma-54 interaction domain [Salinibacter ruber M8]
MGSLDADRFGRLAYVPVVFVELVLDKVLFELVAGVTKVVVRLDELLGRAVPVSVRLHKLIDVVPLNHIALDENEEALDDVVQLADIPPPVVPLQPLDRLFREVLRRKAVALGHPLGNVSGQRGDVFPAVPERGHIDEDDPDAVVEVLPEPSLLDLFHQVLVGGGHHPDIDRNGVLPPDPLNFMLLQHAKHLRLRREAHVPDLVQKQRALVGLLELADALLRGPGKGPLLVPKQLTLDQLTRDRGTVYLHHRFIGPARFVVQPLGHELLAGAVLAGDEHPRLRGGHPLDRVLDRLDLVALPNDRGQVPGVLLGDRLSHATVFDLQLPVVQGVADGHQQAVEVRRLFDKVERPQLGRLHGGLDGAVAADHEDRHLVALVGDRFENLHAVHLRHLHVEDHQVVGILAEGHQRLLPVDRLLHAKVLVLQNFAERPPDARLVVYDQNRGHAAKGDSSTGKTCGRSEGRPATRGRSAPRTLPPHMLPPHSRNARPRTEEATTTRMCCPGAPSPAPGTVRRCWPARSPGTPPESARRPQWPPRTGRPLRRPVPR